MTILFTFFSGKFRWKYRVSAVFLLALAAHTVLGQDDAGPAKKWNRSSLIAAARNFSSAYLAAQSRSRETRAALAGAQAARFPTLRAASDLSYLTNPPGLKVEAGSLFPGIPPLVPPLPPDDMRFSLSEKTHYKFGLTLEQPVFTWGRIQYSIEAASLGYQAGLIGQVMEERNLCTAIDSHLAALAVLDEIRTIISEQELKARRLIFLSEESYASGFILNTDLLEARLLAAEVNLAGYESREQSARTLLALRNLTGIADLVFDDIELPPAIASNGGENSRRSYTGEDRPALLSRLSQDNDSLKLLELQAQAREKLFDAARGQSLGKPELGLFAELNYSGSRFPFIQSGWNTENEVNLTLTLGIRALLFDGGAMKSGIQQKEEEAVQARLDAGQGRLDLEEYLENTLNELDVSRLRQEYLGLKVEAEQVRKEQAKNTWEAGYGEERTFLAHELAWYTNRIELFREELSALLLTFRLENILGIDYPQEEVHY
ncbi:MAG: TolC family protein [Spirochaetaceae bacterium]|nr:TolC family protein [Spirochaetaceae bacterium]